MFVSKNLLSSSPLIKNRFFLLMNENEFLSIGVQKYLDSMTDISLGTLSTFVSNEDIFNFVNLDPTDLDSNQFYVLIESLCGIWRNFILNMILDYNIKYQTPVDAWTAFISYFEVNSKEKTQSIFFIRHNDNSNHYDPIYSIKAVFHDCNVNPLIDIDQHINEQTTLFEFQIPTARVFSLEDSDFVDFDFDSFDHIKNNSVILNPDFN